MFIFPMKTKLARPNPKKQMLENVYQNIT